MTTPLNWILWLALVAPAMGQQAKQRGTAPSVGPNVPVTSSKLAVTPGELDFGPVANGGEVSLPLTLQNIAFLPLQVQRLRFLLGGSGNSIAYNVEIDGTEYSGGSGNVTHVLAPPHPLAGGEQLVVTVTFTPQLEQFDNFILRFEANSNVVDVAVSGLGGHVGDPYLHTVIDGPEWIVDYDENGSEPLVLDGTGSHTHEPGHSLAAYEWRVESVVESTAITLSTTISAPTTHIELEIFDDNDPPHSLVGSKDVRLVDPDEIPGVLARYYNASGIGASNLLMAVPATADFVEQRSSMNVGGFGQIGGSPFSSATMVQLQGRLTVDQVGLYTLSTMGGAASVLFIDDVEVTGPIFLVDVHDIEARFAVDTLADLVLDVLIKETGPPLPIPAIQLTHDVTGMAPVVNTMTASGLIAGGDPITIQGLGFFPPSQVVVHWGTMDLIAQDFTSLTADKIQFLSPPGGGAIAVSVETDNGTSNVRTFLYQLTGPPPVQFRRDLILAVADPTAGVWAPDGRLYVSSLDGRITALAFDEDYELISQTQFTGVSGLGNFETLALAVNPYDPPSPVKLYVAHGDHFVNGGLTPPPFSPYTGQISVLTGPNFNTPVPLITGLPVSNHDHAINGIVFDNNGDLLISVGSMTNAGVKAINSGDLPESPLSAAVVKAHLTRPGFNGAITYVETVSGLPNLDQRDGEIVDVAPGIDVEVHAAGIRNAFGMVYTTKSLLYATDNGPNLGFGPASTGPSTQTSDPFDDDELNLIEWGNYYGSPNRNRGRTDPRQNVYYAGLDGPPSIPDTLFQMVSWLPPSCDGVDEYRANTFAGALRGELIVQEYPGQLRRVKLKADGRGQITQSTLSPNTAGLGCVVGPGGAIVAFDYEHNEVEILEADDLTPVDLVAHDIFPWRAPAAGGTPFVLSGRGFGTLVTTAVTIGGLPATLTSVSWGRIHGVIPVQASPTTALLDVVVTVGPQSSTLTKAFRFLLGPGAEPGRWDTLANTSLAIGEVGAAVIDGTMFLVGEGVAATYAFDAQNRQWLAAKAARPFIGHHHSAEAVDGLLYLIGGIDGGSEGRVQIYDPGTDSWTSGADMPWSAGSLSTATIDGKIYAAGGVSSGGFTVANCAEYDPVADTWTVKATMPDSGRNHTAAGTDGSRFYVFGGRRGGNFPTNGFDSVMIYDPLLDSWTWSGEMGSTLAPLPEARGGMGSAVWLRGEFYIFGGETLDDPDAGPNGVYDRVDVYDPLANTWRAEAPMLTPRHGIFPVLYQGHIFLAGGGLVAGPSSTQTFDTFTRQ